MLVNQYFFFGKGIGHTIRGLVVNGRVIYYRTEEEEAERVNLLLEEEDNKKKHQFETEGKAKLDAAYTKLPKEFKERLDLFRKNNLDFRWKYESYEMFVCEEAVKIVTSLNNASNVREFKELSNEKQLAWVPSLSDGHSGNTLDAACFLALLYIEHPELVSRSHGALCPLVGCKGYGCYAAYHKAETIEDILNKEQ